MENNYDFGEELHNKLKNIDTTDNLGRLKMEKSIEPTYINTVINILEDGIFLHYYTKKIIKHLQIKN